jgi:putative DNA primase/helicase
MTDPIRAKPTGAISRTYVDDDLRKVGKAKTLASPSGIVRLTPNGDVLSGLRLAEGLETALTAMAVGLRPMWATGSTETMKKIAVLPGIDCVTIVADHDAEKALSAAR